MVSENVAYGGPVVGLFLGAVILLYGITQGEVNVLVVVGGLIGVASVMVLAWGAVALERGDAHHGDRVE